MSRLDSELWTRRPCGTVGPVGFGVSAAVRGRLVYAPLHDYHLTAPDVPANLPVRLVRYRNRKELAASPPVVARNPLITKVFPTSKDADVFGAGAFAVGTDALLSVMIAIPRYEDPRTAYIVYWWQDTEAGIATLANNVVWTLLQHSAAEQGYIGLTTEYSTTALNDRFARKFGLFQTAQDCLTANGRADL